MSELTIYQYKAQGFDKKKGLTLGNDYIKGTVEAKSKASAINKIREMHLMPIEVKEVSTTGLQMEINLRPPRIKLKDLAVAVRELSAMLTAGLPLIQALTSVKNHSVSKTLKKSLTEVTKKVESGDSFSKALESQDNLYPDLMIGMVKVGETGGFLDESLTSLADNLEDDVTLRSKIKTAMAYPIVVSAMAVIGVAIMLIFVVPIFEDMFSGVGSELPAPTRLLVSMSENIHFLLLGFLALVLSYIFIWPKYKHREEVKAFLDPIKLKIPILSPIYHKILISRFAKNMSTMLSSGVPLMQALTIVGDTSGNYVLEKAVSELADEVRAGRSLIEPLQEKEIFPDLLVQLVASGEETGSLEDMFTEVSKFYTREVNASTDKLASIIEPLLIVVMGTVIGGMVIALYMPMFSIYGEML